MAKSKEKKVKQEKYRSEEQNEIIRFIRILIIVVVLILGIYFLTRIFVTKDLFNNELVFTFTTILNDTKIEKRFYIQRKFLNFYSILIIF